MGCVLLTRTPEQAQLLSHFTDETTELQGKSSVSASQWWSQAARHALGLSGPADPGTALPGDGCEKGSGEQSSRWTMPLQKVQGRTEMGTASSDGSGSLRRAESSFYSISSMEAGKKKKKPFWMTYRRSSLFFERQRYKMGVPPSTG